MTQMTVAQVLVRFLKEQGVRHVFGVSGHSIFDITDAIYQEPDIDFVPSQIEVARDTWPMDMRGGRAG